MVRRLASKSQTSGREFNKRQSRTVAQVRYGTIISLLAILIWSFRALAATTCSAPRELNAAENQTLIVFNQRLMASERAYASKDPKRILQADNYAASLVAWALNHHFTGFEFKQKLLADEVAHQLRAALNMSLGPYDPSVMYFNDVWQRIEAFGGADLYILQLAGNRLSARINSYYKDQERRMRGLGPASARTYQSLLHLEAQREHEQSLLQMVELNSKASIAYSQAVQQMARNRSYVAGQVALTAGAGAVVLASAGALTGSLAFTAPFVAAATEAAGTAGSLAASATLGSMGGAASAFVIDRYDHFMNALRQLEANGGEGSYACDFIQEMNKNGGRDFADVAKGAIMGAFAGSFFGVKAIFVPGPTTQSIFYAVKLVTGFSLGQSAWYGGKAVHAAMKAYELEPKRVWETEQSLQAMDAAQLAFTEKHNALARQQLNIALKYAQLSGQNLLAAILTGTVLKGYPEEQAAALAAGRAKIMALVAKSSDNAGTAIYTFAHLFRVTTPAMAGQPVAP